MVTAVWPGSKVNISKTRSGLTERVGVCPVFVQPSYMGYFVSTRRIKTHIHVLVSITFDSELTVVFLLTADVIDPAASSTGRGNSRCHLAARMAAILYFFEARRTLPFKFISSRR